MLLVSCLFVPFVAFVVNSTAGYRIKTHRYLVSLTGTDDDVDKATGIRIIPAARFLTAFA
jgi:hypothetical protein